MLVVEILSDGTSRRDHVQKRTFYVEVGIPEYWIVDGANRTVRVVQPRADDTVTSDMLTWRPAGVAESLVIDVRALFHDALD
jgi:Uma2 family endonuclease